MSAPEVDKVGDAIAALHRAIEFTRVELVALDTSRSRLSAHYVDGLARNLVVPRAASVLAALNGTPTEDGDGFARAVDAADVAHAGRTRELLDASVRIDAAMTYVEATVPGAVATDAARDACYLSIAALSNAGLLRDMPHGGELPDDAVARDVVVEAAAFAGYLAGGQPGVRDRETWLSAPESVRAYWRRVARAVTATTGDVP